MSLEINVEEHERKFLEFMADEFICLFHGDGVDRSEQLQDALRKARTVMTGVDGLIHGIKRSVPKIIEDA